MIPQVSLGQFVFVVFILVSQKRHCTFEHLPVHLGQNMLHMLVQMNSTGNI